VGIGRGEWYLPEFTPKKSCINPSMTGVTNWASDVLKEKADLLTKERTKVWFPEPCYLARRR